MAFTVTDFSLAASFTSADVLTKVGEVMADIGLMANPTAWHDSFTDTSSSEVRIVAQTQGTGTYATVYHAFFTKATYDGLWYTIYYNWDVATHESLGAQYEDHPYIYEHPDDLSLSSWGSYYVKIGNFTTTSALTIETYTSTGETSYVRFKNGSEDRLMGVVPSTVTATGQKPRSIYGPNTIFGLAGAYGAPLAILTRSEQGAWHPNGVTTNDYASNPLYTGMAEGGTLTTTRLFGDLNNPWNVGVDGIGGTTVNHALVGDRYDGVGNIPIMRSAYSDASLGENLVYIFGHNGGAFTPSNGDKFIVTAAVEEYLIHKVEALTSNNTGYEFVCVCLRIV